MKKDNLNRRDNPLRMNSVYKDQIACLLDITTKLTELDKDRFDIDTLVKEIFPLIHNAIPYVSEMFIIKSSFDDKITVEGNNYKLKKTSIISDWDEKKDLIFWNYEEHPLNISTNPPKEAVCISHLCKLINDDTYFLLIVRDEEKKPFLSHEIQAIRIYSKILGWFIHYSLTDEVNRYMLVKHFKTTFEKQQN
jgi:hypothetical protein